MSQDVLIPFALDPRLDEDCLFIVFEEDFRFTPPLGDPAWTHKGRKDTSGLIESSLFKSSRPPTSSGASSSSAPPTTEPTAGQPAQPSQHPAAWVRKAKSASGDLTVPEKAPASDWQVVSLFLRDLVAYSVEAHRLKRGDFMFMGWQPHGAGDTSDTKFRYRSGTMLTMFSKNGARLVRGGFEHDDQLSRPGHIDQRLRAFWSKKENTSVSYIAPPIAGYFEHVSGCSREFRRKARPTIWMEEFACPGTRTSHDWAVPQREKWLCTFTVNGKCDFVSKIDIEKDDLDLTWTTYDAREKEEREPTASYSGWSDEPKWSNWSWDDTGHSWKKETMRATRAKRAARKRESFRTWTEVESKAATSNFLSFPLMSLCLVQVCVWFCDLQGISDSVHRV